MIDQAKAGKRKALWVEEWEANAYKCYGCPALLRNKLTNTYRCNDGICAIKGRIDKKYRPLSSEEEAKLPRLPRLDLLAGRIDEMYHKGRRVTLRPLEEK
jgi:hypothetical protein